MRDSFQRFLFTSVFQPDVRHTCFSQQFLFHAHIASYVKNDSLWLQVELTNIQKKYYRAILERNFTFLSKGGTTHMPSLMNAMMELRKCCNHPYLINGQ